VAFHAPDVTPGEVVVALREAGAMLLAWALRLDELGLVRVPAAYGATVALTYEDYATGPAKRWRSEALALLALCVERARVDAITSPAATDCASFKQTYARVFPRAVRRTDGGSPSACACDPGDPLCTAMTGWCQP
jgi:hypothetical protein